MRSWNRTAAPLAVLACGAGPLIAHAQSAKKGNPPLTTPPPAATPHDSGLNAPFIKADPEAYVGRFEVDSREVYAQRAAIVEALGLRSGMAAADVGAGTGLFTRLMAEKVGPTGKVYAVDVSEPFLAYVGEQSRRQGQTQVWTVRGSQESTNLAPGSVDLVFLCDTYHHLENPRATLASIHRALRPGGQLVVVDFDRSKNPKNDFVQKHVRADRSVFALEVTGAGFQEQPVPEPLPLKENFLMRFRKVGDKPTPPSGGVG